VTKGNTEAISICHCLVAVVWFYECGVRRVFVFVTGDPSILLQGVGNLNMICETE
jgi:hypothetical protein